LVLNDAVNAASRGFTAPFTAIQAKERLQFTSAFQKAHHKNASFYVPLFENPLFIRY